MPTRLIHQELLTSPSLLRCSPRAQDGFHRLILIADDFGCFEAEAIVVKGIGWAKRQDVSAEDVARWLVEWSRARMLLLWVQRGRCFGYLTGWHGEKGQRWRVEYKPKQAGGTKAEQRGSKRHTPLPPGWTGADPSPWEPPPGWVPGAVYTPAGNVRELGLFDDKNLSLFLPGREHHTEGPVSRPPVAVAVAVADPDPDPDLSSLRSEGGAEAKQVRSAPAAAAGGLGEQAGGVAAGVNGQAATMVAPPVATALAGDQGPRQAEARSEFARWLVENYPDIRDPAAFERVQSAANPGVDLLAEARKALAWETANPAHRKHNHGRFLHGWFRRAQDDVAGGRVAAARNGAQPKATVPAARFSETRTREFT